MRTFLPPHLLVIPFQIHFSGHHKLQTDQNTSYITLHYEQSSTAEQNIF